MSDAKTMPRYPIYVVSKGRGDCCLTARFLVKDKVPFRIVIEPQDEESYAKEFGKERLLILPFSNVGGGRPARNWLWEHSIKEGHARHWVLDDNIRSIFRRWKAHRMYCESGVAFRVIEDFVDRYENIAIGGMNYKMFIPEGHRYPPFTLNVHVYSCILLSNSIPHRWRGWYNEDTDLCLQVLADGLCTVSFNAFLADKIRTMTMKGGNMGQGGAGIYLGDGRLKMARALERMWPGVVTTNRRFDRPQHIVKDSWKRFDTPLKRRADIDFDALPAVDNYGMRIKQVKKTKSEKLRKLIEGA